jgi:hypothetical protein
MPKDQNAISLSNSERRTLRRIIARGNTSPHEARVARILLKSDTQLQGGNWTAKEISKAFKIDLSLVRQTQKRYLKQGLEFTLQRQSVGGASNQVAVINADATQVNVIPDDTVSVSFPGGSVNVGSNATDGTTVTFPGGNVSVNGDGTVVNYPGGGVNVTSNGVTVNNTDSTQSTKGASMFELAFPGGTSISITGDGIKIGYTGGGVSVGNDGVTVDVDAGEGVNIDGDGISTPGTDITITPDEFSIEYPTGGVSFTPKEGFSTTYPGGGVIINPDGSGSVTYFGGGVTFGSSGVTVDSSSFGGIFGAFF